MTMDNCDPIVSGKWQETEKKTLDKLQDARAFYRALSEINRKWSRYVSIIVMICTALAPIFVVSANAGSHFISGQFDRYAAIIITFILAIAEGTKRIFRFEQRWATCYMAYRALTRTRDRYRMQRIGKCTGSPEWVSNYLAFKAEYDNITDTETKQFFDTMKKGNDKSPEADDNPSTTPETAKPTPG